jgi:hypothetical protein
MCAVSRDLMLPSKSRRGWKPFAHLYSAHHSLNAHCPPLSQHGSTRPNNHSSAPTTRKRGESDPNVPPKKCKTRHSKGDSDEVDEHKEGPGKGVDVERKAEECSKSGGSLWLQMWPGWQHQAEFKIVDAIKNIVSKRY